MSFSDINFLKKFLLGFGLMFSSVNSTNAAPGDLSNSPLFTSNSAPPNVIFEVDDSGSMDYEILTKKYWDVFSYRSGDDSEGTFVESGSHMSKQNSGSSLLRFVYIFDNDDNLYTSKCDSDDASRGTIELCNSSIIKNYDWRVKSSSLNIMYYNPDTSYEPWQKGDGTIMDAASFSSARSDPQTGSTGYSKTKNLQGIIYHIWSDTHGFTGTRPTSGTINKKTGANGLVDWWDEHIRYTVNASTIKVENIVYDGAGISEKVDSTKTLTGSGAHDELGGQTIEEVQQNIANWYLYSRRRAFVAKAAIADVITDKPDYRYGLNFINDSSFPYDGGTTSLVEVPSGNGSITNNTKLISGLFELNWPAVGTPLRQGLERAGKYLDNVDGRTDPIIEQCQNNFTLLLTDGYWNKSDPASAIGNADGDGYSITVADVAKYYYDKDLSPLDNNVLTSVFDKAEHQHMVTYTVAFGLTGLLTDTDNDGWPEVVVGNDASGNPKDKETGDWGDPSVSDTPEKIDDLWHAAYNSRGEFVSAETPEDVSQALSDALSNIDDRLGSGASVSFNTTTLTQSSAVFLALFNSSNNKWSGDLVSFALDPVTGDVASDPTWSASDVLDALAAPVTSRNIFTYNGSTGVPFLWSNLTTAQKDDFKVNPNSSVSGSTKAEARLNFIRGDRTNEEGNSGTYTFRNRRNLLGDSVNSGPVYVGKPILSWPHVSPFPSTVGTNTYSDFQASSAKTREPIIYQGSNDGMLHGFKASDGSETMAYIPSSVFSSSSATNGLHFLTDIDYTHRYFVDMPITISDAYIDKDDGNSLNWYTILIGGGGAGSKGLFALDITDPSLFTENTTNATNLVLWEFDQTDDSDMGFTFSRPTIVMMNNDRWAAVFGNGYNSTGSGEAVLFIVFLDGGLDGVWTDGSSGSDTDYIKITTKTGSISSSDCSNGSSDCNGLSTPQVVDLDGDKVVDRVYAGDLKGNMWAFDVSASSDNSWAVAYKSGSTPKPLFTATYHNTLVAGDPPSQINTTPQSITNKPILVKHPDKLGGDPDVLVFFGTGQYLVDSDINNTAIQSFYGVWDNGSHSLTPANLIEQEFLSKTFVNDGNDVSSRVRVLTDNAVDYASGDKGWMVNLSLASGERVIVDPDVRGDLVFFNTWIPDTDPCDPGGSGFLMSVKQSNGGRPEKAAFDLNGKDKVNSDDLVSVTETVDGVEVVTFYAPSGESFDSGLPASSSFLSDKQYTPGTDGDDIDQRDVEELSDSATGRLSWQELRN